MSHQADTVCSLSDVSQRLILIDQGSAMAPLSTLCNNLQDTAYRMLDGSTSLAHVGMTLPGRLRCACRVMAGG